MSILTWILLFTLFGGVLSALAAGLFLLVPIGARNRMLPHLISFATGALSGLTDNYIRVLIPELKQEAVGKEVTVKITESETPLTIGTIC